MKTKLHITWHDGRRTIGRSGNETAFPHGCNPRIEEVAALRLSKHGFQRAAGGGALDAAGEPGILINRQAITIFSGAARAGSGIRLVCFESFLIECAALPIEATEFISF